MMSHGRVPRKRRPVEPVSSPPQPALRPPLNVHPEPGLPSGQDILNTENVELRRILIEQLGYDQFLQQVGGLIRDRDSDPGGERQLVLVPLEDDEPLMLLKVICPSTGHLHVLRVPPYLRSCHEAAAWIAGFDNPEDYRPFVEA